MRHGLVLLFDLFDEICMQSRAETRASIAQDLEGGSYGARDRVVTELEPLSPYHSSLRIATELVIPT